MIKLTASALSELALVDLQGFLARGRGTRDGAVERQPPPSVADKTPWPEQKSVFVFDLPRLLGRVWRPVV